MLFLLVIPVLGVVALVYRYFQIYAPSNVLTRRVRTSTPTLRSATGLLLLTLVLLSLMHALAEAVATGAPVWLNLVVLLLAWDAIKVGCLTIGVWLRALAMACRRMARAGARSSRPATYS
jgi:hypothetical protein